MDGVGRPLYGGFLTCSLPDNCLDVSVIREVPDNQEVFCHKNTDQSIIVDILEYQEQVQGKQAPRYHFMDIAEANDAVESSEITIIESIPRNQLLMDECEEAWCLCGVQTVSKYNEECYLYEIQNGGKWNKEDASNKINFHLALFRLPQFGTDLVITMNDPIQISGQSSSINSTQANSTDKWTITTFKNMLCTLKIVDSSIFS